jgi:hypothetical protein
VRRPRPGWRVRSSRTLSRRLPRCAPRRSR